MELSDGHEGETVSAFVGICTDDIRSCQCAKTGEEARLIIYKSAGAKGITMINGILYFTSLQKIRK
jgi:hypothetical protein